MAEARRTLLAEYQAARAKLRRRVASPAFIGGVLLGGIALGYLVIGRSRSKRLVESERPGAWSRAGKSLQVLLPLLMALNSATKTTRSPRAKASGTAI